MTSFNIKGSLSGSGSLKGGLSGHGTISANLTTPKLVYPGIYTGSYSVTPDHEEQVLHTSNLLLTSDIHVAAIPEPEFVQVVWDKSYKLSETSFNGWTPSTTAASIIGTQTAGTFVADLANYEYIIKWEFTFNAVTIAGATLKAQLILEAADQYQKIFKRPNTIANIQADNWIGNTQLSAFTVPFIRYYNTSGTNTYTYSISNGIYPSLGTPTFSNSTSNTPTVTVKTPVIYAKCSTTYFATSRAPQLDQDQSIITVKGKLYRNMIPGTVRDC